MPTTCQISGCKNDAPAVISEHRLCLLHFRSLWKPVARKCAGKPRSVTRPHERQREIMAFITTNGESLARVATCGLHLTDDLKARILSTFLTLMNLRENLDRANMRSSFGRISHPR